MLMLAVAFFASGLVVLLAREPAEEGGRKGLRCGGMAVAEEGREHLLEAIEVVGVENGVGGRQFVAMIDLPERHEEPRPRHLREGDRRRLPQRWRERRDDQEHVRVARARGDGNAGLFGVETDCDRGPGSGNREDGQPLGSNAGEKAEDAAMSARAHARRADGLVALAFAHCRRSPP